MTADFPPELVGTSWDTPEGRAKHARISTDPPTPTELCTPEPWIEQALTIVRADELFADGDIPERYVAQALADTAGYRDGET